MDYDFLQALEAIARIKGIEQDILYDALEAGLLAAGRRRFGEHAIISAQVDLDEGRVLVWLTKKVVRRVKDQVIEISMKDARYLAGSEVVIGDELDIEVDTSEFGRSAAQTAKQVVMQRIREAERDTIFEEYKHREGSLINGIVQGDSAGGIVIDLGRTDGIMPYSERIPREQYRKGDRVKAYVLEVRKTNRSPQIILSRRTPKLVEQLFDQEIPEVADGTVEIAAIARDPGFRTKVAVRSNDSNVDAVGTCVGLRGYRIQAIVRELDQERVDLVLWDREIVRFAKHAFNPVEVLRAEYDELRDRILVIVPEEKLSVAIGKGGRNIKLASRLVGIRIDVRSPEQYEEEKTALTAQEEQEEVVADLIELPAIGEITAMNLYKAGFDGIEAVAAASINELVQAKGIGAKTAGKLIEAAKTILEEEDY